MAFQYALPKDTMRLAQHITSCGNLGLVLDKYQPWDFVLGNGSKKAGQVKGEWFKELANQDNQGKLFDAQLLGRVRGRWEAVAEGGAKFSLWSATPLLVGLGGGGTLETGMTLHPLYGFPYIPATTLKGVARARIFYDLAGHLGVPGLTNEQAGAYDKRPTPFQLLDQLLETELSPDNKTWPTLLKQLQADELVQAEAGAIVEVTPDSLKEFLDASDFQAVFGTLAQAGGVTFFDAVPITLPTIEVDIMNPHYADYYGEGNDAPHEGHARLNPVTFLAVAAGTQFRFGVKARARNDDELAKKAARWLRSGLMNLGVGGKTSSGYGLMVKERPLDITTRTHRQYYYNRGG